MSEIQVATDHSQMLAELAGVAPGAYCVDSQRSWIRFWAAEGRCGWLTVTRDDNGNSSVMWTTNKDTHYPLGRWGCARSVTLRPDGVLVAYFESALTMWIKWGYGRGGEAEFNRAMEFATWAHARLHGKTEVTGI
jgi:hypothetical protein